jgi:hypothetical protein
LCPGAATCSPGSRTCCPDVAQQDIRVKNESGKQVRLYLRAGPVDAADRGFLSKLRLSVASASGALFDAQADELGGLGANRLLGTFKDDGGTNLTVTLSVPAELGNEYMARAGAIPWVFVAEEIEDEVTPDTGDRFMLPFRVGAAVLLPGGAAWDGEQLVPARRAEKSAAREPRRRGREIRAFQ